MEAQRHSGGSGGGELDVALPLACEILGREGLAGGQRWQRGSRNRVVRDVGAMLLDVVYSGPCRLLQNLGLVWREVHEDGGFIWFWQGGLEIDGYAADLGGESDGSVMEDGGVERTRRQIGASRRGMRAVFVVKVDLGMGAPHGGPGYADGRDHGCVLLGGMHVGVGELGLIFRTAATCPSEIEDRF